MINKVARAWIGTAQSWLTYPVSILIGMVTTRQMRRCAFGFIIYVMYTGSTSVMTSSYAMDYEGVVYRFWLDFIDSYWYPTTSTYLLFESEPNRLLPGESEPTGLIKNTHSFLPPSPAGAQCNDFRVVRMSEADGLELKKPFRGHQTKGKLYMELEGWLAGFYQPSRARFWIAAMLPKGSPPLFNEDGVGLNPVVMSGPMKTGFGWPAEGVSGLPADRLLLRSVTNCAGFDLYYVEYVG